MMEVAVIARLAELVDEAGFGTLLQNADAARHGGRRKAMLQIGETAGTVDRQRVAAERSPGVHHFLERLTSDALTIELELRAPTLGEVAEARALVRVGLADGLHDGDGHFIRYAGDQTVWPAVASQLKGEMACVIFLRFKGASYRQVEVPSVTQTQVTGDIVDE